jgi:SAM-dependent methyltransferase
MEVNSSVGVLKRLLSVPILWDSVQSVLGAMKFKRELYLSKLHPPGKLLDFGCADGHIADAFAGFDYYGVDIDPVAIEAAKRRYRDRPNMHFIAADLCTRPFPADEFDEILFACTIHHLDDERLLSLLKALHYCMKPGGTIHVFDLVRQDKDGWSQNLMRRLDQGKYTRTLPQIVSLIESLGLFHCGEPSFHAPYGALLRDCDVLYMPLRKRTRGQTIDSSSLSEDRMASAAV